MRCLVAILLLLLVTLVSAQTTIVGIEKRAETPCYDAGEKIIYNIKYGFIGGGRATIWTEDETIDGKQVKHVTCFGETVGVVDMIYKIRDKYESFIDPKTEMPVKAIRNIREGRYTYYDEIVYVRDSCIVHTLKKGTDTIPENALDIVSAFFHARSNTFNDDLGINDTIFYDTYFAGSSFPLRIKYIGIETLKSDFGMIECYVFAPVTEVGRSFETEDDMRLWISRDENRIPVRIKFDLKIGSIVCELSKVEGTKFPFPPE